MYDYAPWPKKENNLLYFEHPIKIENKEYILKINNRNEEMNIIAKEFNSSINILYSNSFTLIQLQKMNNFFRMFDIINEVILNLKQLFEENKYKISINDKSFIIELLPGILIKNQLQFILDLNEKSQEEKINDLTDITNSILKRLDYLEKENSELKLKVQELTEKLNQQESYNSSDIFFKDSIILKSNKDKEKMLNFLNKKIENSELIYRGTRDGDLAKNFHEKCDNKGPTLVLCKDKNEQIFGGFTTAEWDSNQRHSKNDKNAFIFSITNNKKFESRNFENSIECNPIFGPVFGFGGDLTIVDKFLSKQSNMWINQNTYFDKKYEITNGKVFFDLVELEVYLIKF